MQIILNGEPSEVPEAITLGQLVERLELTGKRLAIEVNSTLAPRSTHAQHLLHPDDRVEIIHAVGGG